MLHVSLRRRQVSARWLIALTACCALSLAVGFTPATAQDASNADVAQAESLSRAGRHLEAAARYEQLARRGLFSWDAGLALLAAREYAAAGEADEAERLLDKARSRVSTGDDLALLAAVEARLALEDGNAARALLVLRSLPSTVPAELAPELLAMRGRAEIETGQPLAAIRTFEQRGALLATPQARGENDRLLLGLLMQRPPALPVALAGVSEQERGWLELPGVLAAAGGDPAATDPDSVQRLQDWIQQHPGHPGAAFLPQGTETAVASAAQLGGQPLTKIAVLLPFSGKHRAAGAAVRDGLSAAWFASGAAAARPRIEMYDTAPGVAAAYQRAVAEGAQVVVGPLLKEEVVALVNALPSGLPLPTLALNVAFAPGALPPQFLFQFALDPEQEARAVARRIAQDGHVRGIALFPDSPWGQRVHAAFVAELQQTGSVTLTTAPFYAAGAKDFSAPLRAALGRFGGAGDRSADRSRPAPARDGAAERLAGPQFAFIAATPSAARALRPQLRFQMAYDLPLYATSDAWEPSVRSAADMDGLVFPEIPWLLYGGQGAPELWDAVNDEWSRAARGRLRLYAFGFDAFRLAQQIGNGALVVGIDGLTGPLELGRTDGRIVRAFEFARIEGGRPQPAGTGPPVTIIDEPGTNSTGRTLAP